MLNLATVLFIVLQNFIYSYPQTLHQFVMHVYLMSEVSIKSVRLFPSSSSSPVFHPSSPPPPTPHALVSPSSPVCVNHSLYHQMLLKERWELWSAAAVIYLQSHTCGPHDLVLLLIVLLDRRNSVWVCISDHDLVCACAQIQFWTSPPDKCTITCNKLTTEGFKSRWGRGKIKGSGYMCKGN